MEKRTNHLVNILAGFLLLNLIWYSFALVLDLRALPLPHKVYADWHKALDSNILTHLSISLLRVSTGLAIALILALIFGLSMGMSERMNKILEPFVYFSYPIPKLALLPIIMILLGIGEIPKITMIVLIIVFQLSISIRDAIKAVPYENYALMISLRATLWQKIKHISLPAILPATLSSLKISVGLAFSALFFTETFGSKYGLGFYISDCWMRLDYLQMYFALFILALAGFFIFLVLDIMEHLLCPWKFRS